MIKFCFLHEKEKECSLKPTLPLASWTWAVTVDVGWPWVSGERCIIMHEARSREL